jgi:hypothetical protein
MVPEKPEAYPDPTMFGELPAFGMYLRHGAAVMLSNVTLTSAPDDRRLGLIAEDIDGLELRNVHAAKRLLNVRLE